MLQLNWYSSDFLSRVNVIPILFDRFAIQVSQRQSVHVLCRKIGQSISQLIMMKSLAVKYFNRSEAREVSDGAALRLFLPSRTSKESDFHPHLHISPSNQVYIFIILLNCSKCEDCET